MGPSSEWCLPSPDMVTTAVAMAMEDTGEAITGMADTVDTTARGLLMPSPRLRLMPSPLLPLSPAMATTAEDTAMEVTATDTAMAVDMDTTARGPLMPSPDMVTTAEGTDTDMATDMATATDTATATT